MNDMLEFIGEGYGQAALCAFRKQRMEKYVSTIIERVGIPTIVVTMINDDPDLYGDRRYYKTCDVAAMAKEFVFNLDEDCLKYLLIDTRIPNENGLELFQTLFEYNCGVAIVQRVDTPETHEARQQAEKRQKLEGIAKEVAARHGVTVDSLEFIAAVESDIENIRQDAEDRQYGMREDGLCIGWGATPEQWQDEYNAVATHASSQTGTLSDVLEWLATECPLLWAKYQESKCDT